MRFQHYQDIAILELLNEVKQNEFGILDLRILTDARTVTYIWESVFYKESMTTGNLHHCLQLALTTL